jgi:F-type H+-transporting ATPase subunit b
MNRVLRLGRWLGALLVVAVPAVVWASPEAGHGGDEHGGHGGKGLGDIEWFAIFPDKGEPAGFLWTLLNFGVLFWILNKLLFVPLREGHHKKRALIKGELDRATAAREKAEGLMAEYKTKVDGLDKEVDDILKTARTTAKTEKERILADAQAEAQKIRESAVAAAGREGERIRKEIEADVVDRAVDAAEKAIRAKLGTGDQKQMFADHLTEVADIKLEERAG